MKTWQILVVLSVAAMLTTSFAGKSCKPQTPEKPCPSVCPAVYSPVCCTETRSNQKKEFSNECQMEVYNCEHRGCEEYKVSSHGPC